MKSLSYLAYLGEVILSRTNIIYKIIFQVTDVYGFNIAFEISARNESLKSCNLEVCNFNGECHAYRNPKEPGIM